MKALTRFAIVIGVAALVGACSATSSGGGSSQDAESSTTTSANADSGGDAGATTAAAGGTDGTATTDGAAAADGGGTDMQDTGADMTTDGAAASDGGTDMQDTGADFQTGEDTGTDGLDTDGQDTGGDSGGTGCTPDCAFMLCGDDGCGGSCGSCAANEVCDDSGTCIDEVATTGPVPTGACTNADDQAIVDEQDVETIARDCAISNLGNPAAATTCIEDATGLSTPCIVCFNGIVECGIASCIGDCIIDSASAACNDCIEENCYAPFIECSGLEP
jgi:hypothetical protein